MVKSVASATQHQTRSISGEKSPHVMFPGWPSFYLAIAAGLLMSGGYRPEGHWILTLLGLSLYFALLRNRKAWAIFLLSLVFVFAWCGPLWWWVTHSVGMVSVWLLLTSIEAVIIGLVMMAISWWHRLGRTDFFSPLIYALLWISAEQIRASFPLSGFAWLTTGVAVFQGPWEAAVPFIGEIGTGIFVAFLAWFISRLVTVQTFLIWRIGGLAVLALIFLGTWVAPSPSHAVNARPLTVGVVQGGVAQPWQRSFATPGKVTSDAMYVWQKALSSADKADLYLMGETAFDKDPRVSELTGGMLAETGENTKVPLVGGTNRYYSLNKRQVRANEVFVTVAGKAVPENNPDVHRTYDKKIPVPYGEYIPMRTLSLTLMPTITDYIPADVIAGRGSPVLDIPAARGEVRAAVGLCYEVAYATHIADGVLDGGQFLYVPTNNVSFLNSHESYQQLEILRLRSLESQRYGVQASINGISAIVDDVGNILDQTRLNRSGFLSTRIGLNSYITMATKNAHAMYWFAIGCGLALWLALLVIRFKQKTLS